MATPGACYRAAHEPVAVASRARMRLRCRACVPSCAAVDPGSGATAGRRRASGAERVHGRGRTAGRRRDVPRQHSLLRHGRVVTDRLAPLLAFSPAAEPAPVLRAGIERRGPRLSLRYVLGGAVRNVRLAERISEPRRLDDLWTQTCFEAFLAPARGDAYWEINLSPSGDWNVYRFDGYRRGMRPETRVPGAVTELDRASCGTVTLRAAIDLAPLPELASGALDASLAAVVQMSDGTLSYWAAAHGTDRPDFHRRGSFVIRLDASP